MADTNVKQYLTVFLHYRNILRIDIEIAFKKHEKCFYVVLFKLCRGDYNDTIYNALYSCFSCLQTRDRVMGTTSLLFVQYLP